MFGLLARRKAAGIDTGAEAVARDSSASARRKRLFDRTVMVPDTPPDKPLLRLTFGLKPADD
jgi:hypothetical protein